MTIRDRFARLTATTAWRYTMLGLGWLLLAMTPLVGPIPGPGGILVFAAGATLLLRNSAWVKRHYVRFKRRHPRYGAWADRGLRRQSARRRTERDRDAAAQRLT